MLRESHASLLLYIQQQKLQSQYLAGLVKIGKIHLQSLCYLWFQVSTDGLGTSSPWIMRVTTHKGFAHNLRDCPKVIGESQMRPTDNIITQNVSHK